MKTELDLSFIHRTLKTTGVVLLIGALFGLYYFGVWPSLAFLSGGIWGMVNLMFITGLIRATIRPGGVNTSLADGTVRFVTGEEPVSATARITWRSREMLVPFIEPDVSSTKVMVMGRRVSGASKERTPICRS